MAVQRSGTPLAGSSSSRETGRLSPWLRRFHAADDSVVRLVCLPHAGGAATYYFPLSKAWTPALDVLAVQYPGRQDRRAEPCVTSIEAMADLIADELRPWTDRPVALFGHSMGATIGYEVARRLERDGTSVLGLVASGRRAPSTFHDEPIHSHDDDRIITSLAEMSGVNPAALADEEFLRMILPAMRADYHAVESYRHTAGTELTCPVAVLVGDADPVTSVDSTRAWREHTEAACTVEVLPGGHFYLNDHLARVADLVARQVDAWTAR